MNRVRENNGFIIGNVEIGSGEGVLYDRGNGGVILDVRQHELQVKSYIIVIKVNGGLLSKVRAQISSSGVVDSRTSINILSRNESR